MRKGSKFAFIPVFIHSQCGKAAALDSGLNQEVVSGVCAAKVSRPFISSTSSENWESLLKKQRIVGKT